jgi:hypothetical protein
MDCQRAELSEMLVKGERITNSKSLSHGEAHAIDEAPCLVAVLEEGPRLVDVVLRNSLQARLAL